MDDEASEALRQLHADLLAIHRDRKIIHRDRWTIALALVLMGGSLLILTAWYSWAVLQTYRSIERETVEHRAEARAWREYVRQWMDRVEKQREAIVCEPN